MFTTKLCIRKHKANQKIITLILTVILTASVLFVVNPIQPAQAAATHELRAIQWQSTDTYRNQDATDSLTEAIEAMPDANVMYVDVRIIRSGSTITPYTTGLVEYQAACTKINAAGLDLMVRIRISDQTTFNPTDKTEFFNTYEDSVEYWANFSEANGAEYFCIGTEFTYLENALYTAQWQSVIAAAKAIFSGVVFYETNYWVQNTGTINSRDQKYLQTWFADLDYLSVSAYWDIAQTNTSTVQEMVNEWYDFGWLHTNVVTQQLQNISQAHSLDLILTTGCPSQESAAQYPWRYNYTEAERIVDLEEQRRWFQAFFQVFYDVDFVYGFMIDGAIFTEYNKDPDNNEFSVQNKPAQITIQDWFELSSYEPIEDDSGYFFVDGFESGDFSEWTGTYETNPTYSDLTVATNNPYEGSYNLNASLIKNTSNLYACAYVNISGIGDVANISARNVYFNVLPDEGDDMRFLAFASSVTSSTTIVSAGVATVDGTSKWFLRGITSGTSFESFYGTSEVLVDTNYQLELNLTSADSGSFALLVNNETEIAVNDIDTNGRTLNFAAAGLIASDSPTLTNLNVYLDYVTVNASYSANIYILTMDSTEGGVVNPYPAGASFSFLADTNTTLTATANVGYEFVIWEFNGVNQTGSLSTWFIVMDDDYTAKAYFQVVAVEGVAYNITVAGGNYNLTQGGDYAPHYFGTNASYAIDYVLSQGETLYLAAGEYSDNGTAFEKIVFTSGAQLIGVSKDTVIIYCSTLVSPATGTAMLGGLTMKGNP